MEGQTMGYIVEIFKFLWRLFIKIDIIINEYLFNGNRGETLSSRMGRRIQRQRKEGTKCRWCQFICRVVLKPLAKMLGQEKHCEESIQDEFKRG